MAAATWLRGTIERFALVGVAPADTEEERLRKATLTLASGLIALLACVWVGIYVALGLWGSALIPLAYQVAWVIGLLLLARRGRFAAFRSSQLALILVLPFALQWSLGGFVDASVVALWAFMAPVGALMVLGPRQAVPWYLGFLALLVVSAAMDGELPSKGTEIPDWLATAFFVLDIAGPTLTAFFALEYFVRSRERAFGLLAAEQERSQRLLLNILPRPIAERLKVADGVIADRGEEVSVLFADLTGFTAAVEKLPPEQAVSLLDVIFSTFDDLVESHGLEKIKTIGDGYLVAGGIPTPRPDHAEAVADLALEMVDRFTELPAAQGLALRIGIDTGPVVAGVIGRSKFAYDLWGDTVNTASRMESTGLPGAIQVTARTYERLRPLFVLEQRGEVEVKGKGVLTTYLLLGRKPPDEPTLAGTPEPSKVPRQYSSG